MMEPLLPYAAADKVVEGAAIAVRALRKIVRGGEEEVAVCVRKGKHMLGKERYLVWNKPEEIVLCEKFYSFIVV